MDMFAEALDRLFTDHADAGPASSSSSLPQSSVPPSSVPSSSVLPSSAPPSSIPPSSVSPGAGQAALWKALDDDGFLDLLVPEEQGGAGLGLHHAFDALCLAGRHGIELPFVPTVLARGWCARQGWPVPAGRIALAPAMQHSGEGGRIVLHGVAFGRWADHVLAQVGQRVLLLPTAQAQVSPALDRGSGMADLYWPETPDDATPRPVTGFGVPAALAAVGLACLMAGAARKVLDMTLVHVQTRKQFGRAIAHFQSVRSQASVMAEQVWAMHMAARLACQTEAGLRPDAGRVMVAKARCSSSAVLVADTAHALHGAMGLTQEYDLQRHTRHLREWRRAHGTEAYWERELGSALLSRPSLAVADFMVGGLNPVA